MPWRPPVLTLFHFMDSKRPVSGKRQFATGGEREVARFLFLFGHASSEEACPF